MSPKKYIQFSMIFFGILILISLVLYIGYFPNSKKYNGNDNIVMAKVHEKTIQINKNGKWEDFFIKGVNIGAAKPGYYPNEFGITKEEYLNWFQEIHNMNANTIRVYTLLSPEFYEALSEFNRGKKNPIYLIQGIWVNDKDIKDTMDAEEPIIKEKLTRDIKSTVNAMYGGVYIPPNNEYAHGRYKSNVSDYVLGYILGVEWDSNFVYSTNFFHEGIKSYRGKYLTVKQGKPFECFLAEMGDYLIKHEKETYGHQRLLAFSNWPSTDPIINKDDKDKYDDLSNINVEDIEPTSEYKSGMFASYHIFPYYIGIGEDESVSNNNIKNYREYIKGIYEHHTIPVVIAEFGVPTSRGIAHLDKSEKYNDGFISESQQGKDLVEMYNDIREEKCSGAIVSSWQDEWFKNTWNTKLTADEGRLAYWHNVQSSDQSYGLKSFDPGKETVFSYPDSSQKEWTDDYILSESEDKQNKIYVNSDSSYIYINVKAKDFNMEGDKLYLGLDVTGKSGSSKVSLLGLNFDRDVDYVVEINGMDNSRIYVHDYYNALRYEDKDSPEDQVGEISKNSNKFNKIYMNVQEMRKNRDAKENYKAKYIETGKLLYGNANPKEPNSNSLADFYVSNGNIEMRIPWGLLNVSDPTKKRAVEKVKRDLKVDFQGIRGIYFGAIIKNGEKTYQINSELYNWDRWNKPEYHERLKPSYYEMKEAFSK